MTESSRTMTLTEGSQVLLWVRASSPPGSPSTTYQGPEAVNKGAVCSP